MTDSLLLFSDHHAIDMNNIQKIKKMGAIDCEKMHHDRKGFGFPA